MKHLYDTEMKNGIEKTKRLVELASRKGKRKDIVTYNEILYETSTQNFSIEMQYIPGVTLTEFSSPFRNPGVLSEKELFFYCQEHTLFDPSLAQVRNCTPRHQAGQRHVRHWEWTNRPD